MELPKKLMDEIWEYCRVNKITDVDGFILKMFNQGFTVEKFGATPTERIVEKEVEKIVEVEVIKEIEVIKEVPVEVIKEVSVEVIKEIEVIKEVKVADDVELTKVLQDRSELQIELTATQLTLLDITKERDGLKSTHHVDKEKHDTLMTKLGAEIKRLNSELDIEKKKNKKDIYGEH